jgi:hypothetical protein
MKLITKLATLGFAISLLCSGCGTGVTVIAMVSPTITTVSPQAVTAGTPSVTVTVQGSNFAANSSLTVNGIAVPTTVVNSTTLAAQISGTPLAQPSVQQLQVNTDGAKSNQVQLTVTNPVSGPSALSIGTPNLPSGQVGVSYSGSFSVGGGTGPYIWGVTSGSLPAGLTLSTAGVLSGTPTASGTSNFSITVTDSSSPAQQKTLSLSLPVLPAATTPVPVSIGAASLGAGKIGAGYGASLSASGGTPGYTWSIASGSLPAGLTLSAAGVISGTPTASGNSTFTVAVQDSGSPAQTASVPESITVSPAALSVTSASLTAAKNGNSYSATLSASGGTPGYTWSVSSGSLPAGLTLSAAGVISGTPTGSGSSTFTIAVQDSGSPAQTASVQQSITVSPAGLAITSTNLAAGKNGNQYSAPLSANGGTPGYTWSVSSGNLPAGLTLSSAGVISGTPTASGSSTFTIAVQDSGSPAQTASAQESITVSAAGLAITSTNLAAGKNGNQYSAPLNANGGTPGYTWSVSSGNLPAGLTLSSTGVISGTPTGSGSSTFTIAVQDSGSPALTASAQESITVAAAPATLTITSTTLGAAQTGNQYSTTLNASGGTPGYTWSVSSGNLPAGLTLSSTGVISGTPTASGSSTFTLAVQDNGSPAQTASAPESLTVSVPQLAVTTSSLGTGTNGSSYSAQLNANGGSPGYTWTIASGNLPAGLTLSNGVISGTPTATGVATFTVSVTDSGSPSESATAQESIVIDSAPTPGQAQLYLYPQAPVAPRGSYQTVTAVITGVNDKTVTWTTDGGTIVGTNPCVVNEPCTVALYTTTKGTYHLTATSNANHAVVATSTITMTDSPTPVTTHPRLGGITAATLPALRAKAVSSNPLYMVLYQNAVTAYNNDNAIWSWSCNGGSGQPSSDQTENWKEGDAYLFAFMSMIDPNDSTYKWGCYGRDLWIYYANFWINPLSSAYSADTLSLRQVDAKDGLTGNHGADSTEYLTLTPDWLMAGGYLNASDLATTRTYFAVASHQMIYYISTGARAIIGSYNSSAQFHTGSVWDYVGQRAMGNNYSFSKMMFLTAASLTFNNTVDDDPAEPNTCNANRDTVCPDGTAGSLHAYWNYLTGGVLYKTWAHIEDPAVSWAAYQAAYSNLPTQPTCIDSSTGTQVPCFGDGRGGESAEGSWYQYSMYRFALAMASIQSAGYDDPIAYGPQMSAATSSWWDLKAVSDLEFLTYMHYPKQLRFSFFSTGDSLNLDRGPSDFNAQAWLMVNDSWTGRSDRTPLLLWPLLYSTQGGLSAFYQELQNTYGGDNGVPLFIALPAEDPTTNPPADPKPALPTDLYNGGNQHILVRSGWDTNWTMSASDGDGGQNTVFSYYCQNSRIDHEHETCGGFDLLSHGEFITKMRTVFNDYNEMLATAEHSNIAGYEIDPGDTTCATSSSCFEWQAALGSDNLGGGQFYHGYQAGSATLAHAELPNYVATVVDTTNLYNGSAAVNWGDMTGITAASRSLLYLRNSNQVIYYDRGVGGSNSKRLWVTTTGPITLSNNTASWPTRSGQQEAYVTSLLPANATLSDAGAYLTREVDPDTQDWEPYSHLKIDAGSPAATQFLTVMEWGGSSFTKSNTVLVQSTAGQNFDGALVGSTLVMFLRNWPAGFTGVTYPASGATTQYVSDLTPNTAYTITGNGTPATVTTDTAGVLTFSSSGTGSITVAPVQ